MPDEPLESGQESPDNGEMPKPNYSESSDDKQTSAAAKEKAGPDADELKKLIDDAVERKIQSAKDQRVDRLYKELGGDPRKVLEAVASGKVDAEEALKQYDTEERENLFSRLSRLEEAANSPQKPSGGNSEADEAYSDAVGLIREAGLANDSKVRELMGETYKSPADMLTAVNKYVLKNSVKPEPSGASVTQPSGGSPTSRDASEVEADINKLLSGRDVATPSGRAKLRELREELQNIED